MDSRIENEIAFGKALADRLRNNQSGLFDAGAIDYWEKPGAQQVRRQKRVERLRSLLAGADRCLEIGCGFGSWSAEVSDIVGHVDAIDVSPDIVELAKQRNVPNITFSARDVHDTGFPAETFDRVFCISVLHHLDMPRALAEIHRILKPGGMLVASEPNMLNPQVALERSTPMTRRMFGNSPDETAFVRWRLAKLLERHFSIEKMENFDFYHPVIGKIDPSGRLEKIVDFFERVPGLKEISGSIFIVCRKPDQAHAAEAA
ncbi:MAG: hypothetical protein CMM50_14990 [Rhodospirillaceae bacterium]|mgnify:CR=1 FL=1|nr:hypothetical protein [Rhodospirillaceae bacterium]